MKSIIMMLIYLFTFIGGYLLISCIGLLFYDENLSHYSYSFIIGDSGWFCIYTLFLGWWIALLPTLEYHQKYKLHFKGVYA